MVPELTSRRGGWLDFTILVVPRWTAARWIARRSRRVLLSSREPLSTLSGLFVSKISVVPKRSPEADTDQRFSPRHLKGIAQPLGKVSSRRAPARSAESGSPVTSSAAGNHALHPSPSRPWTGRYRSLHSGSIRSARSSGEPRARKRSVPREVGFAQHRPGRWWRCSQGSADVASEWRNHECGTDECRGDLTNIGGRANSTPTRRSPTIIWASR
jgi:hypothetical protein